MRLTWHSWLPSLLVMALALSMYIHGPITQLSHYHEFADARMVWGVENGVDVLSNAGFLVVGFWAVCALIGARKKAGVHGVFVGYLSFALSILATAFASSYYHLAPDDARLFWDRLPIALACASLLLTVRLSFVQSGWRMYCEFVFWLGAAWWSVWWWQSTADLRPYLAMQVLAIVLIPLWQHLYQLRASQRVAFAWAIALYVLAKLCELGDAVILSHLVWVSGHSLKHVLSALAAGVILWEGIAAFRIEKCTAGV